MTDSNSNIGPLINLNVGGKKFSTSRETLTWINDTFFSSLLSGRISSHKDEHGFIFIDRDPKLFRCILNFLRTKEVDLNDININALKREAEYYGIHPLVARLTACEELNRSSCGNVLFHGMLQTPTLPVSSQKDSYFRQPTPSHIPTVTGQDQHSDVAGESVLLITGHNSWIAVAYTHCVLCYKIKESCGWQQVFSSPYLPQRIRRIAINAKVQGMAPDSKTRMVAVAFTSSISLWSFQDEAMSTEIGTFDMSARIDSLFFIGSQLVATGGHNNGAVGGRVGVWNAVSQHWQTQDVSSITSYDSAGSFLLLGGVNGSINYIDMQKFPLRLKDNDLLITELYRDHASAAITALSVYLTPKNSITVGNWIEVAYGTATGVVCVIVQHPELVGQGFQLFQTFAVHLNPVCKVMLSEKHLVSVCSDNNHVRTWTVTRFRGMISTQPGSTPLASFKILALEPLHTSGATSHGNNIGPHGEREETQIFIQKLFPVCDQLFIRTSSSGERVAEIKSVDGSPVSCFCLHECESSSRMGSRPRRYLFTGHMNGTIQIWDISTALELFNHSKDRKKALSGPTQEELLSLLGQCDLHVSSQHALSLPSNCSPGEMSYLLNKLLLRSSCQSLSGSETSDGTLCHKRTSQRSYEWAEKLNIAAPTTNDDQSTGAHSSAHSLHRRGHSESSPLTRRVDMSARQLRHSHSMSADAPHPTASYLHPSAGYSRGEPAKTPQPGSSTNV